MPLRDDQYQLVDAGAGRKLERFGQYVLDRPCAQAVWKPALPPEEWRRLADAFFTREHGNRWEFRDRAVAKGWRCVLEGITFLLCIPLTAYGLYYNVAALVKHSRPVWESALWLPFLALLLWVCIDNLFFPDRNE